MPLLWSDHFFIGSLNESAPAAGSGDPLEGLTVAFVRSENPAAITPGNIQLREGELMAYDSQSGMGVVYFGLDQIAVEQAPIEIIGVLDNGMISVGLEPVVIDSAPPMRAPVSPAAAVPEPASAMLLTLGGLAMVRRRRR